MKKICRQYHIQRWPYRKLSALRNKKKKIEETLDNEPHMSVYQKLKLEKALEKINESIANKYSKMYYYQEYKKVSENQIKDKQAIAQAQGQQPLLLYPFPPQNTIPQQNSLFTTGGANTNLAYYPTGTTNRNTMLNTASMINHTNPMMVNPNMSLPMMWNTGSMGLNLGGTNPEMATYPFGSNANNTTAASNWINNRASTSPPPPSLQTQQQQQQLPPSLQQPLQQQQIPQQQQLIGTNEDLQQQQPMFTNTPFLLNTNPLNAMLANTLSNPQQQQQQQQMPQQHQTQMQQPLMNYSTYSVPFSSTTSSSVFPPYDPTIFPHPQ